MDHVKERGINMHTNLDQSPENNHAEWKRPIPKGYIYWMIPSTYDSRNEKIIKVENRLVAVRD